MANNEILPFAGTNTGTNLLTQAEYNADSQRLIGNQPGIARSNLVNKALRQTSLIASAIAQYFANRQSSDITDSLSAATLAGYMLNAIGGDTQKNSFNSAIAAGTADAITASYTPSVAALTNGLSLFVRATAANTSTTPTFTPNNGVVTAKAIVKGNNLALVAGDIAGAGHWLELQYDSTLDKWVLQNPANGIVSQLLPSGSVIYVAQGTAPSGFLKANGAAVSRSTYSALFSAIGTTYGAGDGATTFNLPDLRAEFIRGLDDGRAIDVGRTLGSAQTDSFQGHWHNMTYSAAQAVGAGGNTYAEHVTGGNNAGPITDSVRAPISDGSNGAPRTSTETRPRNVALLACIKY